MSAAGAGPAGPWPFPGAVWGEYPERAPAQSADRRRRGHTPKDLRQFAEDVCASPRPEPEEFKRRLEALHSAPSAGAAAGAAWLREAFILVSAAMAHAMGLAPYVQQLTAARFLLDNTLTEMATGEGKTVAIAMAAAVAALARTPVHVVTANDYLAQRDAEQLQPFYRLLGLRAGFVTQPMAAAAT